LRAVRTRQHIAAHRHQADDTDRLHGAGLLFAKRLGLRESNSGGAKPSLSPKQQQGEREGSAFCSDVVQMHRGGFPQERVDSMNLQPSDGGNLYRFFDAQLIRAVDTAQIDFAS
jgi:hypothetical protein